MQALSALLTPLIAFLAVYIAWAQWTTARRKLALDLFERRFQLYQNVRASVRPIISSGKTTMEDQQAFLRSQDEARFLFGPDVYEYLEDVWVAIVHLDLHNSEIEELKGEERSVAVKSRRAAFDIISHLPNAFPKLLERYMRMDAPVPRTPRQWFDDLNGRRKSFGDGA